MKEKKRRRGQEEKRRRGEEEKRRRRNAGLHDRDDIGRACFTGANKISPRIVHVLVQ